MIFSSPEFILFFLPATILVYYFLIQRKFTKYIPFLIFSSSLIYYAWWNISNLFVIIISVLFNYNSGLLLAKSHIWRKYLFIFGVAVNLASLVFFKYTNFTLESLNHLFNFNLPMQAIVLPLGISFFTFQQIAYISDIYTKKYNPVLSGYGFLDYCCFVCFFPQLVAGPIVHHHELMPQFHNARNHAINWENIFNGIVVFSIGLAKKVLIADQLSPFVKYSFETVQSLSFAEACFGSLCYTLQLYFDFSAYSDMAIGAALFFNIVLPWNFDSPYKALNIQDFWRRWHITLSRWLRDYLYIPLGGNRRGTMRMSGNIFITFLLGGLWHGAAWTFVIWGAVHGFALAIHRFWIKLNLRMPVLAGWFVTFIFINLTWIIFRAPDMQSLKRFAQAFLGQNGYAFRDSFQAGARALFPGMPFTVILTCLLIALAICLLLPNSRTIGKWSPNSKLWLAIALSVASIIAILLPEATPEFIYSNF